MQVSGGLELHSPNGTGIGHMARSNPRLFNCQRNPYLSRCRRTFSEDAFAPPGYGQAEPLSKSCSRLMAAVLRFSEAAKSKTRACWQFFGTPFPLI